MIPRLVVRFLPLIDDAINSLQLPEAEADDDDVQQAERVKKRGDLHPFVPKSREIVGQSCRAFAPPAS